MELLPLQTHNRGLELFLFYILLLGIETKPKSIYNG
jgi:hypothetical protein